MGSARRGTPVRRDRARSARTPRPRPSDRSSAALLDPAERLDAVLWEAGPRDGRRRRIVPGSGTFLGYPARLWASRSGFWRERLHPEDRERVLLECEAGESSRDRFQVDYRMVAADGRATWFRDLIQVARDARGRRAGIRGVMVDVTALRRARGASAQRESRLRLQREISDRIARGAGAAEIASCVVRGLSELLPDFRISYSTVDAAGVFRVVESSSPDAMPDITGDTADLSAAPDYLAELRAGGAVLVTDVERDARVAPLRDLLLGVRIRAALDVPLCRGEELVGLLCCDSPEPRAWGEHEVATVAEAARTLEVALRGLAALERHRLAEEALRASESRFRLLVENAPFGVLIGRQGRLLYANPASVRMFGWESMEAMLAAEPWSYAAPESREMMRDRALRRERGEDVPRSYEFTARRADGSTFPAHANAAVIDLAEGPATVGFVMDLTERRRAEDALRLSEEMLRHSQKMEAVGRLAGGVAHDFNNLLTAILGYSEMLDRGLAADPGLRPLVTEVRRAAERAADLTRQLLAFSRKQVVALEEVDLNRVVRELHSMLQRVIGEDVALRLELSEKDCWVRADLGGLEQVLVNLAVNARDAMPAGGTLTLQTEVGVMEACPARALGVRSGPCVTLTVRDSGVGMDRETLSHLFEPFFTTKEPGRGTGLGLSTAYGIVRQCEGSIVAESQPGKGATFRIVLPEVRPSAAGRAARGGERERKGGNETILVVEDEPVVRGLVRATLEARGYRVLDAGTGEDALALSRAHPEPIHMLVTDVVMPGMSGRELADVLRAERGGLRVLFCSGYTDDAIVRHGVREQDLAFLAKPFTPRVLAARVREALDAAPRR